MPLACFRLVLYVHRTILFACRPLQSWSSRWGSYEKRWANISIWGEAYEHEGRVGANESWVKPRTGQVERRGQTAKAPPRPRTQTFCETKMTAKRGKTGNWCPAAGKQTTGAKRQKTHKGQLTSECCFASDWLNSSKHVCYEWLENDTRVVFNR